MGSIHEVDQEDVEHRLERLTKINDELREVNSKQAAALQALRDLGPEYTNRRMTAALVGFEPYRNEVNQIVDAVTPDDLGPQERAGLPDSALSLRPGDLDQMKVALSDVQQWTPLELWPLVDYLIEQVGLRRVDLPQDDLLGNVCALRSQVNTHGRPFALAESLALQGWYVLDQDAATDVVDKSILTVETPFPFERLSDMLINIDPSTETRERSEIAEHIIRDLGVVNEQYPEREKALEALTSVLNKIDLAPDVELAGALGIRGWYVDPKFWTADHERLRRVIATSDTTWEAVAETLERYGIQRNEPPLMNRETIRYIISHCDADYWTALPRALVREGWTIKVPTEDHANHVNVSVVRKETEDVDLAPITQEELGGALGQIRGYGSMEVAPLVLGMIHHVGLVAPGGESATRNPAGIARSLTDLIEQHGRGSAFTKALVDQGWTLSTREQ